MKDIIMLIITQVSTLLENIEKMNLKKFRGNRQAFIKRNERCQSMSQQKTKLKQLPRKERDARLSWQQTICCLLTRKLFRGNRLWGPSRKEKADGKSWQQTQPRSNYLEGIKPNPEMQTRATKRFGAFSK